ncbi:MAG: hypothetical protein ACRCYC_05345 [Paraclostridium sp.]|uniref:hypothetical protein n=1 Tax=Paraclostridium sp. TaxID=2023273 RepID=UPI003F2B69DD
MFEFEYENTIEDFVRGEEIRHSLSFKRVFLDITFADLILPVFLLLYGLYCIHVGVNIPGILMLILAVALPLDEKFPSPKSRSRVYRNKYTKIIQDCPHLLLEKTFTIDNTDIKIFFSNRTVIVHSLDVFKKCVLGENAIYLYAYKDYSLLTIIPYSTFKSEEDRDKFSEYIKMQQNLK